MVRINGKKFTIYTLDNTDTIKNRIAADMDTLPKYLIFPEGMFVNDLTNSNNTDLVVVDFLSEIKKSSNQTDFKQFNDEKLVIPVGLTIKDVLLLWLMFNKGISEIALDNSAILLAVGDNLVKNNYFPDENTFEKYWDEQRHEDLTELTNMINYNKLISNRELELYKTFDDIPNEDIPYYTPYEPDKITFTIDLIFPEPVVTLLEIFNYISLNENIPFAKCNDYYKILKDYLPPLEWAETKLDKKSTPTDELVLYISNISSPRDYKNFTKVIITILPDTLTIQAQISLIIEKGYLKQDEFINRFLTAFDIAPAGQRVTFKNLKEIEVSGIFFFPLNIFNSYIFSDLVATNKIFSQLISIDESTKMTKKKSDTNQTWLYLRFDHPNTGSITAIMSQRFVDRSSPEMSGRDTDMFAHNQPYIKIRFHGRDKNTIEIFENILAKLLYIYEKEKDNVIKEYQKFLPGFGPVEMVVTVLKKKPTELAAPEVFITNYSRNCVDERMPTILLTEKEVNNMEITGNQVMKFPRDITKPDGSTYNTPYISDGNNQQYYACLNPEFPYPGLRENTLVANRESYPYVPCCFKTDQADKKNSPYNIYYNDQVVEIKEKKQHELILTNKILLPDQYGVLSNNLIKLFDTLDGNINYRYIRIGVNRDKNSFLSAVVLGMYNDTNILSIAHGDRPQYISNLRKELSDLNIVTLARQCIYNLTSEQISQILINGEAYLDPKLYIQLLEGFFNCNIFIFNSEGIVTPKFLQGYYRLLDKDRSTIFIYEHLGSESDHATYPQCELIIRWNERQSNDTQYFFERGDKITRNIRKVFDMANESYILTNKLTYTSFPLLGDENITLVDQIVDNYGKTRCVNIKYNDQKISIITTPIAPISLIERNTNKNKIYKIPVELALEFLNKMNLVPISQTISLDVLKEINTISGNVVISIPVSGNILNNVNISQEEVHYTDKKISALSMYNKNKKLARYLTEYIFWLFSKYLQERNIGEITDYVLAKFAHNKITIIPNYVYGNVLKSFSLNSPLLKDKKLVLLSNEMLKRLMYVLKLYSIRNIKSLRSYYAQPTISHYYEDISDFDRRDGQVILQDMDSLNKWIQEGKSIQELHRSVIIGQRSPYFFKNTLINNKVYIAQNIDSLKKAIAIGLNWQNLGYNIGEMVNLEDSSWKDGNYSFILYSYRNADEITSKNIIGDIEPKENIEIIGYKVNGVPRYTVLLALN